MVCPGPDGGVVGGAPCGQTRDCVHQRGAGAGQCALRGLRCMRRAVSSQVALGAGGAMSARPVGRHPRVAFEGGAHGVVSEPAAHLEPCARSQRSPVCKRTKSVRKDRITAFFQTGWCRWPCPGVCVNELPCIGGFRVATVCWEGRRERVLIVDSLADPLFGTRTAHNHMVVALDGPSAAVAERLNPVLPQVSTDEIQCVSLAFAWWPWWLARWLRLCSHGFPFHHLRLYAPTVAGRNAELWYYGFSGMCCAFRMNVSLSSVGIRQQVSGRRTTRFSRPTAANGQAINRRSCLTGKVRRSVTNSLNQ